MHRVSEQIDAGEFFARSHPVAISPGINALEMHRITWPQMGPFIRRQVAVILEAECDAPRGSSHILHDEAMPYRVSHARKCLGVSEEMVSV
jgi:hypothetical protein